MGSCMTLGRRDLVGEVYLEGGVPGEWLLELLSLLKLRHLGARARFRYRNICTRKTANKRTLKMRTSTRDRSFGTWKRLFLIDMAQQEGIDIGTSSTPRRTCSSPTPAISIRWYGTHNDSKQLSMSRKQQVMTVSKLGTTDRDLI